MINASSITELDKEQRQDAYKKYQLIEPYLNGTLKLNDIAKNKQIPIRTLNLWLKKYRQNRLLGLARKQRHDKGIIRKCNNELIKSIEGLYLKPDHAREENKNFTDLVIIDEVERLKHQGLEYLRELYDNGEANFIFIGMPGIDKLLQRFPQLYSRIGFIHNFKKLDATEVKFILQYHLSKLNIDIKEDSFTDQEVMAAIVMSTGGNFRLINRLIKQSLRIMKVNYMTTITKEIIDAARSCLLIGEVN